MKTQAISLLAASVLLAACSGGGSDDPAPVNQAPQIAAIADQTIAANGTSAAIAFSVSDENPAALAVSVTSDRQQVVPDGGIQLAGTGTDRSITVTPVVDTTGDAFITIVATDSAGLSASTSFLLAVDPEQRSMQQFARDAFAADADGEPDLINAVEFAQDAEDDDFADLLAQ